MAHVRLIDTSFRDGNQSLWATRMTNAMILPQLRAFDSMGFEAIDLIGGAVFDVCVRYLHEDPWERIRLARQEAKQTPLNVWTRGQSLFTFEFFPDDVVTLCIRRVAANGIRRYTCYDALNDIRNIELSVREAKAQGMTSCAHLVYTLSPVHTDEYYAGVAQQLAALPVDVIGIKDPSGLLTPERARTLVPRVKSSIGDLPLELHSHCRAGLGELVALEGIEQGVDIVYTGIRPLASSDALPDCRYIVRQLAARRIDAGVDERDVARMEESLYEVAREYDKQVSGYNRFDPYLYHHQVPGGMISNLRSQLRDIGMEDRLEAVLEEAGHVREDLGYPILVSPFAQFVITQSVLNVVTGERYGTIPDEVARYTLGCYGRPAAPIRDEVMDRVRAMRPNDPEVTDRPGLLVEPGLPRLREHCGAGVNDDELLLAAFYQPAQLQPLRQARRQDGGRGPAGLADMVRQIPRLPDGVRHIRLQWDGRAVDASR